MARWNDKGIWNLMLVGEDTVTMRKREILGPLERLSSLPFSM